MADYLSSFLTGTTYPLLWVGLIAVAGVEAYVLYDRRNATTALCRMCRERVALDATVCPHCQRDNPVALADGGSA